MRVNAAVPRCIVRIRRSDTGTTALLITALRCSSIGHRCPEYLLTQAQALIGRDGHWQVLRRAVRSRVLLFRPPCKFLRPWFCRRSVLTLSLLALSHPDLTRSSQGYHTSRGRSTLWKCTEVGIPGSIVLKSDWGLHSKKDTR
jgi:hypothetical protein